MKQLCKKSCGQSHAFTVLCLIWNTGRIFDPSGPGLADRCFRLNPGRRDVRHVATSCSIRFRAKSCHFSWHRHTLSYSARRPIWYRWYIRFARSVSENPKIRWNPACMQSGGIGGSFQEWAVKYRYKKVKSAVLIERPRQSGLLEISCHVWSGD